jgi:hypothetical protein
MQPPANVDDVVTTVETPVFLLPNPERVPLRRLAPGVRLKVIEDGDDWIRVEFLDGQFGVRVGYVQRRNVRRATGGR